MSYSVVSKRRRELSNDSDLADFLNAQKGTVVAVDFQPEKVVLVLLDAHKAKSEK